MPLIYSSHPAENNEKCYHCGAPATVIFLADTVDPETGSIDELGLCDDCIEQYLNLLISERTRQ